MTPNQFCQLLEYIKKNNSWGINMYDLHMKNRKTIKYVIGNFDSRDGSVYRVEFKDITGEPDKVFIVETPEHLDVIYQWLDKPMKNCL